MKEQSERLSRLPTYVFARLDTLKNQARAKGVDLIDLGMGNPDLPPPRAVIDAMVKALEDGAHHRYPSFDGLPAFTQAVSVWMDRQYGVSIDPTKEVVPLIGSKEGLVHFSLAYLNPGDTTLVPMPAYPAHFRGPILANASPIVLPTHERSHFIPDLKMIDDTIARRAKLFFLSYPTNPTAATAPREFFEEAVAFAKHHDLILIHDFAYAEVYFDKAKPHSMLSIKGAKDVCIEFHSFSKTFSMPGWRCGFAVGNPELIATLHRIKTNLDYGLFMAIQEAAIKALEMTDKELDPMRQTYKKRRDIFVAGLQKLGWPITPPQATMYLWIPVPRGYNATDFSLHVLDKTGVVFAPGTAFGDLGEGYVRIALVDKEERLVEALNRLEKAGIRFA